MDIVPANGRVSVDQNDPLGINRVTVHFLLVVEISVRSVFRVPVTLNHETLTVVKDDSEDLVRLCIELRGLS